MTAPPSISLPDQSPQQHARWSLGDWVALALVVIVSTLIRVNAIDKQPSADEVWHLTLTTGHGSPVGIYDSDRVYTKTPGETPLAQAAPIWNVWIGLAGVLHPPLFHVTLRVWRDLFGDSDQVAHLYSIAWSALACGFIVAAARTAMNRAAAIFVGAIYAVSPVQIYFAQEIRNYGILIAFAAMMGWVATRIEVFGPARRRAIVLAGLTLPLLLTHYFAFGAAIGLAAYGIARFRGAVRRDFVLTLVAAGITYLIVWVPFAWQQVSSLNTGDAYTKVDHFDVLGEAWWTVAAPARLLIEGFWLDQFQYAWPALLVGAACVVLPWIVYRKCRPLLPWTAMLLGTMVGVAVLDAVRMTWLTQLIRYLATPSPVVPLIIVGIAWTFHRQAAYLVGGVAVAALLIIPRGPIAVIADAPYYGDMAVFADQSIPQGDALLVRGGEEPLNHLADLQLMSLAHERGRYPRTIAKLTKPPSAELRVALPDQGWLFLPGKFEMPRDDVIDALDVREVLVLPRQGLVVRVGLHSAVHPASQSTSQSR